MKKAPNPVRDINAMPPRTPPMIDPTGVGVGVKVFLEDGSVLSFEVGEVSLADDLELDLGETVLDVEPGQRFDFSTVVKLLGWV